MLEVTVLNYKVTEICQINFRDSDSVYVCTCVGVWVCGVVEDYNFKSTTRF